jgi:hypothetical protein
MVLKREYNREETKLESSNQNLSAARKAMTDGTTDKHNQVESKLQTGQPQPKHKSETFENVSENPPWVAEALVTTQGATTQQVAASQSTTTLRAKSAKQEPRASTKTCKLSQLGPEGFSAKKNPGQNTFVNLEELKLMLKHYNLR